MVNKMRGSPHKRRYPSEDVPLQSIVVRMCWIDSQLAATSVVSRVIQKGVP